MAPSATGTRCSRTRRPEGPARTRSTRMRTVVRTRSKPASRRADGRLTQAKLCASDSPCPGWACSFDYGYSLADPHARVLGRLATPTAPQTMIDQAYPLLRQAGSGNAGRASRCCSTASEAARALLRLGQLLRLCVTTTCSSCIPRRRPVLHMFPPPDYARFRPIVIVAKSMLHPHGARSGNSPRATSRTLLDDPGG